MPSITDMTGGFFFSAIPAIPLPYTVPDRDDARMREAQFRRALLEGAWEEYLLIFLQDTVPGDRLWD